MNATSQTLANILQTSGIIDHYHVPKYQREYTWGRGEWEQLLLDINENNDGYFVGSIICINDNTGLGPGEAKIFEVVDGQQRLTTISLLLMAIYSKLSELKNGLSPEDTDKNNDYVISLSSIRNQLVYRKQSVSGKETGYFEDDNNRSKYCFLRVQPSTQNKNYKDYQHILNEVGVINGDFMSRYCGVRRISKAYNYFYSNLSNDYDEINKLLNKINSLNFVHISVSSSSDAFVLFESLNNRGVPLSAMDIIKNKMLARLAENEMNMDYAFTQWQKLLGYLPEYVDQERFLRQYYNAFKVYPKIRNDKFTRATKSNLIKIYEKFINGNAKATLVVLLEKAKIYNSFIDPSKTKQSKRRKNYLQDLIRIGSAPSYVFLLYLYDLCPDNFEDKESTIDRTLQFLIKYNTRRNITDFPNTHHLVTINTDVIEECHAYIESGNLVGSDFIIDKFLNGKEKPSDIDVFRKALADNLFSFNSGMARFVLAKLNEMYDSKEYGPDLWAKNEKGVYVWTVEHIFPQGRRIPQCWVDMMADGDKEEASDIQAEWVHCLGNLTLSGYNSKLGNASFNEKQELHENRQFLGHKINIGYKNGLALNKLPFSVDGHQTSLAEIDKWTPASIEARNNAMVDALIKIFAFNKEELNNISDQ